MNLHDFVFSEISPTKYYRHILFWTTMYLSNFHIFTQQYNIGSQLVDMAYCYLVVYWVVPKFFLKQKKALFTLWLCGITFLTYLVHGTFYLMTSGYFTQGLETILYQSWFYTTHFIHAGPIMPCGLFISCKIMKNYARKTEEKEMLVKEANIAELQLLKAQVQPHFLFNTLNNIYSFTLNRSPQAAGLVLKLYDTINYMNRDCAAEQVPLEKELKMISDYVGLEKVRYGERLKMEVKIEGDPRNKFIAPLLLIPFVENSFKHGTSKMLEHPWIKMKFKILDDQLDFELQNSKPEQSLPINGKSGIGLANARKRLSLLYPNNHTLDISNTADSFLVRLKLPLESGKTIDKQMNTAPIAEPAA